MIVFAISMVKSHFIAVDASVLQAVRCEDISFCGLTFVSYLSEMSNPMFIFGLGIEKARHRRIKNRHYGFLSEFQPKFSAFVDSPCARSIWKVRWMAGE